MTSKARRLLFAWISCVLLAIALVPSRALADERVDALVQAMPLEEKIAQLIVVPFRRWDGERVLDLLQSPALAKALRAHQFGGVLLFAQNVESGEQTTRLVSELQQNNTHANASAHVPYFVAADQEGGLVERFDWGCRMTGNMAIGAAGERAQENARMSGGIIGEEMAALGFNLDFAPVIDVNVNPANPVIGVRSFSDDPNLVAQLGTQFAVGLSASNVIATYKHFPGHGDVSSDTHFGSAVVDKSLEELMACELVPFAAVAEDAEMMMTAHIVLPQVEDEVELADGSVGYYPATLSREVIGGILRERLGFEGVLVSDSLTMEAISKAGLVPGEEGTPEYGANVAQLALNAGVDLLLEPIDLTGEEAAAYLDEYIALLAEKVSAGDIAEARIDEALTRVLELKEKHGILDLDCSGSQLEQSLELARLTVGSEEHHEKERQIAQEAVTLVKNNGVLPARDARHIVLLGVDPDDVTALRAAVTQMQSAGLIAQDAFVRALDSGETWGGEDSGVSVSIDYCCSTSDWSTPLYAGDLHYSDALRSAIGEADVVLALSRMDNLRWVQESSAPAQGIMQAMSDAHAAGASFVLLSDSLPYDLARYPDADAMLAVYLYTGTAADPTERSEHNTRGSYNANILAGVECAFGLFAPAGRLPVNIPTMVQDEEGRVAFGSETLFERGFGLGYDNFEPVAGSVEPDGGTVEQTSSDNKGSTMGMLPMRLCISLGVCVVAIVSMLFARRRR